MRRESTVIGVAFGILSALGYGAGQFLTQAGLRPRRLTAAQGVVINLVAANLALFGILTVWWRLHPVALNWFGVLCFAAAGIAAPFAGRNLNFMAIQRIGATRTASLGMSESIFAAGIAWVLLDQRLSLLTVAGILVLVTGTALFLGEANRPLEAGEGEEAATRSQARSGVLFALASGLFFAMSGIFRQLGLDALPSALLGSAVGSFTALLVMAGKILRAGQWRGVLRADRRDALFFAASGVSGSGGMVAFFLALQFGGTVAVSTALKNLTPLFTFALAAVFAARWERVTARLGLLVLWIVSGAVLTALGRF